MVKTAKYLAIWMFLVGCELNSQGNTVDETPPAKSIRMYLLNASNYSVSLKCEFSESYSDNECSEMTFEPGFDEVATQLFFRRVAMPSLEELFISYSIVAHTSDDSREEVNINLRDWSYDENASEDMHAVYRYTFLDSSLSTEI